LDDRGLGRGLKRGGLAIRRSKEPEAARGRTWKNKLIETIEALIQRVVKWRAGETNDPRERVKVGRNESDGRNGSPRLGLTWLFYRDQRGYKSEGIISALCKARRGVLKRVHAGQATVKRE